MLSQENSIFFTCVFLYVLQCIYNSKETFELMHCLEELTKDRQYLCPDSDTDVSNIENI